MIIIMNTFKNEFEGFQSWLVTETTNQTQKSFVMLGESHISTPTYRTIRINESQLQDPKIMNDIFKRETLNESEDLPTRDDGKTYTNEWEKGFYQERRDRIQSALQSSKDSADSVVDQATNAIAQSSSTRSEDRIEGLLTKLEAVLTLILDQKK